MFMKLSLVLVFLLVFSVTPVMAQNYCEGSFDCDEDVDGTDASIFKSDFGRSKLLNPCPSLDSCPNPWAPCPVGMVVCNKNICVDTETNENHCGGCNIPCGSGEICIAGSCKIYCSDNYAPVPKTGQTTSYATGDDGDLEKGVTWPNPRFTDNGDGTVTDILTGLIWLKNANCFGERTWNEALSDCNQLASNACGLTDGSSAGDWRLPNYKELFSLVDPKNYNPSLPSGHPFTNVTSYYYWTSTTNEIGSMGHWAVYMSNGAVNDKVASNYDVWPVRGGH